MRHWTPAKKMRVLAYAQKHGHAATIKHFKINPSQLHVWKTAGRDTVAKKAFGTFAMRDKHSMATLVLARRLRISIVKHIKDKEDITDVELNALLLINEILKGKTGHA